MTKLELTREISYKLRMNEAEVGNVIEAFMSTIKNSVVKKESVFLRGFGTFEARKAKAKIARNISKGTALHVPERYLPNFRPAAEFKEKVISGK